MVEIVLDDVPADPLTRDDCVPPWKSLPEVGRRPAGEGILDHVPDCLKAFFSCHSRMIWKFVYSSIAVIVT